MDDQNCSGPLSRKRESGPVFIASSFCLCAAVSPAIFSPTLKGNFGTAKVSKATETAVDTALIGVDYSQEGLFFDSAHREIQPRQSWAAQN